MRIPDLKTYRQRIIIILLWIGLSLSIMPTWAQSAPSEVVNAFLEAWSAKDYERMYGYVTVNQINGVDEYPLQVFTNRYQTVADTLALTELRYTITATELQGMTAMVTYDVIFVSNTFGEITDSGRIIRLINTPNGWKIAWSTMDIFDTLISGAQIRVESRPSPRAVIYDRNGVELAYNGTTTGFYSARGRMVGEQQCIELLANLQRVPIRLIESQLQPYNSETVFFLGELNTDVFNANFSALSSVCGVQQGFESNPHRIYKGNSMTSHVVGYVGPIPAEQLAQYTALGYGQGDIVGLYGIESAYQTQLGGKPASVLRIVDSSGTVLRELAGSAGTPPVPVTLTIDARVQEITANALNEAFVTANPNWASVSTGGAAVVLDVKTGEILALASYPFIQPNLFSPESVTEDRGNILAAMLSVTTGGEPLRNRAASEQASPGSVFKIITLAAALNEGLTVPSEQFNCDLYWDGAKYGDTRSPRPDWRVTDEYPPAGMITPSEALMTSCNPFFWEFGARLFLEKNPNMIAEYGRRMGLTRTYGLSAIFREAPGVIPVPGSVDAAVSEAVGQGDVTLPPLQMGVVVASIANGGTVYSPSLVKQIGGTDGVDVVQTFSPQVLNEFGFNEGVLEAIQTGMCGVTTNELLGTAYGRFISSESEYSYTELTAPYSVCGKTGTAQTGRYPNAWFVAYAPADNPEIAVVVMVEQSLEGSQVSAPIARRILDDYFSVQRAVYPTWWAEGPYVPLNIPPDGGAG